jgi:hypothetical protein
MICSFGDPITQLAIRSHRLVDHTVWPGSARLMRRTPQDKRELVSSWLILFISIRDG